MYRCLLTIAAVAMLSCCFAHLEKAQGQRQIAAGDARTMWVRTVDGWENSELLWLESSRFVAPSLHPTLVAGFQLSASLFVLIAFPSCAKSR
ncbi:MAG: hypothetical protein MI725_17605 [Pirellulales bacterium]|nr:hypothetical protein [Pirellulales bacterium]